MATPSIQESTSELAIIVPAYKATYLKAALQSIAAQTDKRFMVYVCDDSSPEDLEVIYASIFPNSSNSKFIRFPTNLGGQSLVAHWNRCVEQTKGEPWLWLFSDDDLMDPDCVASFHRRREQLDSDVYRFDTLIIDGYDNVTTINPPHPMVEPPLTFAYHRMSFQRNSFAVEYITSRKAFLREGGFVAFPVAWCSDDASWVAFAGNQPIVSIPGARVKWRCSDLNISGSPKRNTMEKIEALVLYSKWLDERVNNATGESEQLIKVALPRLYKYWIERHLKQYYPLTPGQIWRVGKKLSNRWPERSQSRWAVRVLTTHVGWLLRGIGNRL